MSLGIDSKPRCIGWMANGTLTMTEASSSPSKLNTREYPNVSCQAWPMGELQPNVTSR
jgi:hypothetical protein